MMNVATAATTASRGDVDVAEAGGINLLINLSLFLSLSVSLSHFNTLKARKWSTVYIVDTSPSVLE